MKLKRIPFLMILFSAILAISVSSTTSVFASSAFDNVIKTTDTLYLDDGYGAICQDGLKSFDFSSRWAELLIPTDIETTGFNLTPLDDDTKVNVDYSGSVSNEDLSYYFKFDKQNWAVSQYEESTGSGIVKFFNITFTTTSNTSLIFEHFSYEDKSLHSKAANAATTYDVTISVTQISSGECNINVTSTYNGSYDVAYLRNYDGSNTYLRKPLFIYWNVEYPPDYEGIIPPETGPSPDGPEVKRPDYNWTIDGSGKLNITYLKNISPFLMGRSYMVLNKMSDNWADLEDEVFNESQMPTGTLNYTHSTALEPGYYMLRISYDQSFNLPWQPPYPNIDNVWFQFQYTGQPINGTNVGGCEGICNDQLDPNSKVWNLFNSLDGLNTFGLSAFLLAPINFLQTLPAKVGNCTPITLPLLGSDYPVPCMSQFYWSWNTPLMTIYTTVFNASIAFLVAFNIFRTIKNINTPTNDSIEVARL